MSPDTTRDSPLTTEPLTIQQSANLRPATHERLSTHRVLRNSAFNLAAQGIYALIHLVSIMALARGLGQDGLGAYFKLFALILIGQIFAESGVCTIVTHRIARKPEFLRQTVAGAAGVFTLIIAGSLAFFLILGGVWAWSDQSTGLLMRCLAAGMACAAIQTQRFCASIFYAFELFGFDNLMKILQGLLFCTLVLVFINGLGDGTVEVALWLLAASHVAGALFLVIALEIERPCLAWRLNIALARDWLAEAVPFGAGDVLRCVTLQLDTILLGLLKSDAVVGIYSIANRPLGPLNLLPRAILTAAFPSFVRLASEDRAELGRAFAASIRLLWIVSLPIVVSICVCARTFVLLIAGKEYLDSAAPLRILIWVVSLSFLSFQFRFLFAALGRSRLYIMLVGLVLSLEILVGLILIPSFSYFGACIASLSGELLFTSLGLFVCYRLGIRGIDWRAMACALLAAAAMAGMLWFARDFSLGLLVPAGLLSAGVYFVLCVALGALPWSEVRHFGAALAGARGRNGTVDAVS
jgi:O-antigen/teichoic acid export membrane protein